MTSDKRQVISDKRQVTRVSCLSGSSCCAKTRNTQDVPHSCRLSLVTCRLSCRWSLVACHLSLVACLWLAGCANYTTPIVPEEQLAPAERNFQLVWQSTLDVLGEYYFTVDQQDRREGRIATLPLTGQQWFEFWRKDAATREDLAEGSLQTIYRTVRVHVEPVADSEGLFAARVEVFTSRSEQITRPLTNVVQAYNLFAIPGESRRLEAMLSRQSVEDIPHARVIPLGRDEKLESKLAQAIADRVRRTANSSH